MSSVSSKQSIFKQQQAIFDFLDARGIEYLPIDMCANTAARPEMLEKIPEEKKDAGNIFLPPQVFNGTDYCGDFEQFFDAREMDLIYSFFKLDPPAGSSEYTRLNPPSEHDENEEVEEIEEVEEVEEEETLHGTQAVEDTPMDAEGGEEKMALFGALSKTEGEGAAEAEVPVAPEKAASEVDDEDSEVEYVEEIVEVTDDEAEAQQEEVVDMTEAEVHSEVEEQKPAEDTAEVEEYKSDNEWLLA